MREKKKRRKMSSLIVLCMAAMMLCGTVSQADYVKNVKLSRVLAGTSGSVWQYKATGDNSEHASAYAWLSAGIKRSDEYVFDHGTRAVGPKTTLIAYSPTRLGVGSSMSGEYKNN